LTDFQTSFIINTLNNKIPIKTSLKMPSHLKHVATITSEYYCSKADITTSQSSDAFELWLDNWIYNFFTSIV